MYTAHHTPTTHQKTQLYYVYILLLLYIYIYVYKVPKHTKYGGGVDCKKKSDL